MNAKLLEIRNKLSSNLPTGEVDARELLEIVKNHLKELDDYIDNEEPVYPKVFVEHCFKITNKNALDEFYNMWMKHSKELSCKLKGGDDK